MYIVVATQIRSGKEVTIVQFMYHHTHLIGWKYLQTEQLYVHCK